MSPGSHGLKSPEPSTGLRLDDLGLLLEAVRHGHGVGLTRKHFVQDLIATGEIVHLFPDVQLKSPPHAYYIVYEKPVRDRPEVSAFLDWLLSTFRSV